MGGGWHLSLPSKNVQHYTIYKDLQKQPNSSRGRHRVKMWRLSQELLRVFFPGLLEDHGTPRVHAPTPYPILSHRYSHPHNPGFKPRLLKQIRQGWGLQPASEILPAPLPRSPTEKKTGRALPFRSAAPVRRGGSRFQRAQAPQVGGSWRGGPAPVPGKPSECCSVSLSNSRRHQLTSCAPPSPSPKVPSQ